MNCFDWQNRVSDYLDGTLMGALKTEADEHLDQCGKCNERYKHFRTLLTSISSQPRSALPIPIRKSPLAAGLPRFDMARLGRSRWDRVPWYLRTSIEGVGIVLMILLGISAGPRLRSLYERSIEANLAEFTESFREWRESASGEKGDSSVPLARGRFTQTTGEEAAVNQNREDFDSGDAETDTEDDAIVADDGGDNTMETDSGTSDVRVGNSEIWRFIIKTDSPHEIRPRIVKLLTDVRVPKETPGLGGIEAPGGIQFDLLVPQTAVASIKRQLQAMAPKPPEELAHTPAGETFTWYKNKSKRSLPSQKTRVVIWLSQM